MDAAFLKAAEPEPVTILGRELKPFCLGHEFVLQRLKNSFSIESKIRPQLKDLFAAVHICQQPYKKGMTLNGFSIPWRIRIYSELVGPQFVSQEFVRFNNYIAQDSYIPDFYRKEGSQSNDATGTPTLMAVKISLMSNLGFSEMEALNMQVSSAFIHHLFWAEAQGNIQIIDDKERAKIQIAKENEAALDAHAQTIDPNIFKQVLGVAC